MRLKLLHLPIIIAYFTVFLTVSVVLVYNKLVTERQLFDQRVEQELFHFQANLSQVQRLLSDGKLSHVQALFSSLSESQLIEQLLLVSPQYQILASSRIKEEGEYLVKEFPSLFEQLNQLKDLNKEVGKKITLDSAQAFLYPVQFYTSDSTQHLGYIYLNLQLQGLQKDNRSLLLNNIMIVLICMALSFTLLYLSFKFLINSRLGAIESVLIDYLNGRRDIRFKAKKLQEFQKLELLLNSTLDLLEHEYELVEEEHEFYKLIMNTTSEGMITIDQNGNMVMVNNPAFRIFGYETVDDLLNYNISMLIPGQFHTYYEGGRPKSDNASTEKNTVLNRVRQVEGIKKSGEKIPISLTVTNSSHLGELYFTAFILDHSERRKFEQSIDRLAFHDQLTGLYNFNGLKRAVTESGKNCSMSLIELHELRQINDSFGYEFGDEYIHTFTRRLERLPLANMKLSRSSGCRFVISSSQPIEEVKTTILKLWGENTEIFDTKIKFEFFCSAVWIEAFYDFDKYYRNCRIALRNAVIESQQCFVEVNVQWINQQLEQAKIQQNLAMALTKHELSFDFQPKFDANTKLISSVEALLRWRVGDKIISPGVFIPIAEKSRMMLKLDKYVIELACQLLREWKDKSIDPVTLAINLSSTYLYYEENVSFIFEKIGEYNVPAELLELEVTEYGLIEDFNATSKNMNKLQKAGVKIAIDDYGTGHSNLQTVASLPIENLKIDQSFIKQALTSNKSKVILENITHLAHTLGIDTTAEGVETQEQFDYMKKLGCNYIQGYLLSKPLPQVEYEQMLIKQRKL